jgi:hypothetical protein
MNVAYLEEFIDKLLTGEYFIYEREVWNIYEVDDEVYVRVASNIKEHIWNIFMDNDCIPQEVLNHFGYETVLIKNKR